VRAALAAKAAVPAPVADLYAETLSGYAGRHGEPPNAETARRLRAMAYALYLTDPV
jgi:hypothetical protein